MILELHCSGMLCQRLRLVATREDCRCGAACARLLRSRASLEVVCRHHCMNECQPKTAAAAQMHKHRPVTGSAPCIKQLAASGALLIGKSNLHEIGVGMTGLNTRHGTTRNPYDPRCYTGGSSSGSAAAVSSGLCPFALGEADLVAHPSLL